jgi:hypothetical protein
VGINLVRGRTELDCGCFGSQQGQKISTKILIRNVVLMMLSLQVAFWADGFFALDGWLFGTPTIGDDMPSVEGLLPVILVSIGFLLIYLLVKQVIVFRGHYRS